ncbi:MAG: histidine--tRNA ligase [Lachnospiraceae bacterium]|nr:histidine--tRNA ligase [Lachnospiraceae bacterium]
MTLSKKPTTGMKDILPKEMRIRDYVIGVIQETYAGFGFTHIETPCVENISNLNCKAGGENEKLIFRILKRGEKLNLNDAKTEDDVTDLGLRYDLTVPLVRFYSNNAASLPSPFKALQIGPVWRADRPQRGRYRQFYQCDIDILGEPSNLAEIELITATTTTLGKLGFADFKIRLNDRRMLKSMASYAGLPESDYDEIFIILDKMDKIGIDGVREELITAGYDESCVNKYLDLFKGIEDATDSLGYIIDTLGESLGDEVGIGLKEIKESVEAAKTCDFEVEFDPTLVRGMSYYTGPIFEVSMPQYGGSCGGGGRYDEMVGKFTGQNTPACGFSIGFERIVMLLLENDYEIPDEKSKVAFLIEKGVSPDRLSMIIKEAAKLRAQGKTVLVSRMNKNKKFQRTQLEEQGYTEFKDYYREELKH